MEVIVDIGERSNQRVLEKFPSFGWRTTDFFFEFPVIVAVAPKFEAQPIS